MWQLWFSKKADEQLSKMDASIRRIIVAWLLKNIDGCDNPGAHGKGLVADKSGIWRYRVGDYCVLCKIKDDELIELAIEIVLAIEIGHRREICR